MKQTDYGYSRNGFRTLREATFQKGQVQGQKRQPCPRRDLLALPWNARVRLRSGNLTASEFPIWLLTLSGLKRWVGTNTSKATNRPKVLSKFYWKRPTCSRFPFGKRRVVLSEGAPFLLMVFEAKPQTHHHSGKVPKQLGGSTPPKKTKIKKQTSPFSTLAWATGTHFFFGGDPPKQKPRLTHVAPQTLGTPRLTARESPPPVGRPQVTTEPSPWRAL